MQNDIKETEIVYENGVPLAPNVAPIIVVSGSDYEMGYQYSLQLTQIFGPWALEKLKRDFNEDETDILMNYKSLIGEHTPEFIDFFRGMAAGSTDSGVQLSFEEALSDDCLAFNLPPMFRGLGRNEGQEKSGLSNGCSGFAAWGSATRNGRLLCGASGDHEISHEFLLLALPETGNNYIFRAGIPRHSIHPAMNNKGLAYVHHGAGSPGNEEPDKGLSGNVVVQHTLRFANNTGDALEKQLEYPSGSAAAGLWAGTGGEVFVLECRNPLTVRRAGDYGEQDFLYATNNSLVPGLESFLTNRFGWELIYVPRGGWNLDDMNSVRRNLFMWNALHNYNGAVDLDFVKMLWRFPSKPPDYSTLEEADIALYESKGIGWDTHICNLGNGMVGIMLPDEGDNGLYYTTVGPAGRGAEPLTTDWHFYHIAPTYTFFELKLASKPNDIANEAKKRAKYDLYYANRELRKLTYANVEYAPLDAIFNKAATENQKGDYFLDLAHNTNSNESVCNYARAIRGFTRCQAYAKQVHESLIPPATKPENLGLREWFGNWGEWEKNPV